MPTDHRARLRRIRTFPHLIAYLRDEMDWPVGSDDFESLTFDYTPDELGIDAKNAAKIQEIKRLRPLTPKQPWGIFFVKFEPKRLPVVALRRILSRVVLKKRASANQAERPAWAADDLLFVSNYGLGGERQISFAHFSKAQDGHDLPTLKVLGWDNGNTPLHLDTVAEKLTRDLAWPDDVADVEAWRQSWRAAFTLRHREVITTSRDLSIRLAELARATRDRIKTTLAIETERGPLTKLMKAFQETLVHDLDGDGFADMYAQTIAYGLLSARIADPAKKTADDFAGHMRTNPFLRELMQTFLRVGGRRGKAGGPGIDFDELGVSEVLELLGDANMEAVVRDFGDRNPQEDPVIHFYELFLKEYDAKKRMQRGVFYTPRPVVSYIVRSVDELLRTEFGLEDGLADTTTWGEMAKRHKDLTIPEGVPPGHAFVQILDPATGTGTFLVEVIDLMHKTLVAKWTAQGHGEKEIDARWNDYVPTHLLRRLHGYELLMAPYAIAHLKIGLKLYETGYRFASDERARIYLTNALEPAHDFSGTFEFAIPALAHEAEAVNEIKRKQRFTVVIGNPPYSVLSGNLSEEARRIVCRYRYVDGKPIKERSMLRLEMHLQDDYVKFLAMAQGCLDRSNRGVLGFITNNGYLDNLTLRGVRNAFLRQFERIQVLDLHGSRLRPARSGDCADENVFDIDQGVAITVARTRGRGRGDELAELEYSALEARRAEKYEALTNFRCSDLASVRLEPRPIQYFFVPRDLSDWQQYESYSPITEIMPVNISGIITAHDRLVVDFENTRIVENARILRDGSISDEAARERLEVKDNAGWKLEKARRKMGQNEVDADFLKPYAYRPFDTRWIYYHPAVVWSDRRRVMSHVLAGDNVAIATCRQLARGPWEHAFVTRLLQDDSFVSNRTRERSYHFPLFLKEGADAPASSGKSLFSGSDIQPNLSAEYFVRLSATLRSTCDGGEQVPPMDMFGFIYAVLYSPRYRSKYEQFLSTDFPRIPLPGSLDLFRNLACLGGELVALHLMESPKIKDFITTYTGRKNPEVGRVGWSDGTVWLDAGKTSAREGHRATKPGTFGFCGVPEVVWDFRVGCYQVCHKWLKDRKGRTLSKDDIAHYQKVVVALRETIRVMEEIDEVIEEHGGWPGAFRAQGGEEQAAKVIPFRPCIVAPRPKDRYVTCVPLVPLKAAAGAFSDPQHVEDDGRGDEWEWVEVPSQRRLRRGMFVAQVVGRSMEPVIPDGAWCLFTSPVRGTRQDKIVLAQLRDAQDPETGEQYTVKRYNSEKVAHDDSWRHARITLLPVNPEFEPILLAGGEGELDITAELVEVLEDKV